jgi:hypothetical protein
MRAMMHHGRHLKRHVAGRLAAAIVIIAVLFGTALAVNANRGNDTTDRTARTHLEAMRAAVARATDVCRSARELFTEDAVAMNGAIQQWRIHIDAMTQLTSGKIDLAQAVAFWDSTRIEGKRTLALFHRVDGRYRAAHAKCEAPTAANESASGSTADLQACQKRQTATDAVLRDARDTLADWKMHIKDMDALRAGKLSPKHAIHMWHQMYRRGKVELARYDQDHRQLHNVPECPL